MVAVDAAGETSIKPSSESVSAPAKSRLLVFLPSLHGGIGRYALEQSQELARRGEAVLVLATKELPLEEVANLRVRKELLTVPGSIKNRILRRIFLIGCILINQLSLAANIVRHRPNLVLFDGYSEIMAPFWIWPHV